MRFLVAGGLNTALTTLIYFAGLTVFPSSFSYGLAWLAGLVFAMVFYPDRVFPGGRTGFADRLAIGASIAIVFVVGLVSLQVLERILQNTAVAFFVTLATTTILNFLISRWILRRSC
ncbi:polysaccharide synthesis protein GtrA [Mesorhizobium sp. LNJC384A00]|nr:polysaccharide synthesis protein GtrA [Mesorhizobium sp. LSJC255A00]ESX26942.1 polysaccharide synthesis protein GtrA [Mesorhizobium sp. LSHC440B00]ESX36130.1 polysaccharide synthesis protein GtrA [Mesorhizobium sp. LSHC432A00]ESX40327.1 polysaccharide synthesis protein GtrA [Mesorhizobium sp. LSHC440A00]ESX74265.1 polysaccharide synthesis protein GtrA [Mesorhizobium sp. LSHC414A00]ESY29814.1 polysaccharide synthesis protein GtrA [Mesorhizobium sp. LNJC391B00]ESY45131.1 polysaccharide synth